jgi:serralysin
MPGTSNVLLDAIAGVGWLSVGGDAVIKYYFDNGTFHSWTETEKAAYRSALQQFVNVANISIQEVFSPSGADFTERWISNATMVETHGDDFAAVHQFPRSTPPSGGEYNFDGEPYWTPAGMQLGGLGYMVLMHEIGHGLGLAHPHDTAMGTTRLPGVVNSSDLGTFSYNQNLYTVMSYNRGPSLANAIDYGSPATLMAFDIAAIQFLYGANTTYHSGNDGYFMPDANAPGTAWQSIWDTGGIDWVFYFGGRNAVIDLRAATLTNGDPNAGGFVSAAEGIFGGFTIAKGALIENAKGGSGNDKITGNSASNYLSGEAGNDILTPGAGDDEVEGGPGIDTVVYAATLSASTIVEHPGRIVISGPDGNDGLTSIENLQFTDGTVNIGDGSIVFDSLYYDRQNPDVFHANIPAIVHYNASGWREGRDPNPWFDSSFYLGANSDVRAAGLNPLDHYHVGGWREGRDPAPNFDTRLYLINNPDVAAVGIDPLEHFLFAGQKEGRQAYAAIGTAVRGFDAEYYLLQNPDVARAGVDPLSHFNAVGWHEGRNPNAKFDTAGYLSHYSDVAAAGINPLTHYEVSGWTEGRDPSAAFDTLGYLAANPDVAAAHVNPLDHYLNSGIYEGRAAINDGVWR